MPTIHELLDDTQKQCEALVEEMKALKGARALNQKAADGLDATCEALKKTAKAIEPFTEVRVRRLELVFLIATAINVIMFLTLLLVVFFRK